MFRSAGQIESISIGSKSCPAANCPGTHTVKDSKWNPHDSLADKSNVSRPSKSNELRAKKFNAIFPSRGADSLPSYNMEQLFFKPPTETSGDPVPVSLRRHFVQQHLIHQVRLNQ